MAEILGLTVTDFPWLRAKPEFMPGVVMRNMADFWKDKPHLKDPTNWPASMREAWAADNGVAAATAAQNRQIEQFHKLKAELDAFKPDFMVILYRGRPTGIPPYMRFQFVVQAHQQAPIKTYQIIPERGDTRFEGVDVEHVDILKGHQEGALHLVRGLQNHGFTPPYLIETPDENGLVGNVVATATHLDWDRREFATPVVPIAFDPFGFLRTRNTEGMSPWNREAPRPLTPKQSFSLGQAIAKTLRPSPWRVALVAGVDWSHSNDTSVEHGRIHPDVEADQRRYEQWRNNRFTTWGDDWTFEEMEEHAQWELLVTIVLAGAMTELGAKVAYSDFQPNWLFNDNFVTTIFEVK